MWYYKKKEGDEPVGIGMHRIQPAVVRLTHQEPANTVGICRRTVTLFLGRFREEEILDTGKGRSRLYDLDRLHRIAEEER